MKKLVLLLFIAFSIHENVMSQDVSPVITELREIIADAPTGFQSLVGDVDLKDKATSLTIYKTKKPSDISLKETFVMEADASGRRTYIIRYNLANAEALMLRIMLITTKKYVEEMNVMVKSGNYTYEESKKADGTNVTVIKNLQGKAILSYQSSPTQQLIMIHGTNALKSNS